MTKRHRRLAALLNRLATETALVPAWWFIEITNVLAMAERKGRITPTQSDTFIGEVSKFGIARDDGASDRAFTHLLALCRAHRLTSYDAIYLDLALRRSLPLATLNGDLRKTAKKLDVGLFRLEVRRRIALPVLWNDRLLLCSRC
jgi:predicted nucleic acid-binding protein